MSSIPMPGVNMLAGTGSGKVLLVLGVLVVLTIASKQQAAAAAAKAGPQQAPSYSL